MEIETKLYFSLPFEHTETSYLSAIVDWLVVVCLAQDLEFRSRIRLEVILGQMQ